MRGWQRRQKRCPQMHSHHQFPFTNSQNFFLSFLQFYATHRKDKARPELTFLSYLKIKVGHCWAHRGIEVGLLDEAGLLKVGWMVIHETINDPWPFGAPGRALPKYSCWNRVFFFEVQAGKSSSQQWLMGQGVIDTHLALGMSLNGSFDTAARWG